MNISMFLIAGGILVLLLLLSGDQRKRKLSGLLNVVEQRKKEGVVQQLKQHHEAEMVLEKNNAALNYFRKLDSNFSYKLALLGIQLSIAYISDQLFQLELAKNDWLIVSMVALVIAIVLPGRLRAFWVNRRVKRLSAEIPRLVDLLAVCVQCGMTLEKAFAFLSQKMEGINPDFTPFLERLNKRTEVSGLSDALQQFYIDIPTQENRMLCAMLQQSLQYGSALYDQLIILSHEIREVQLLLLEEKIGKIGAKMSVPLILFFMFPVVIIVAVPGVMRMMSNV